MSKRWKIVIGLAFIVAGITVQFRSHSGKDETPAKETAELRGTPIQASIAPKDSAAQASGTNNSKPDYAVGKTSATQSTESSVSKIENGQGSVVAVAQSKPEMAPGGAAGLAANGFMNIGFDKLSTFNYVVPDDAPGTATNTAAVKVPDQIPGTVRALDQKLVSLKGYMLPLKVEAGLVTELLIMKDQSMCCFGSVPKINEWVSVKMAGKGVKAVMDQPVTFFGKLFVGEIRENGYLVGIYRMDGERIGETEGL